MSQRPAPNDTELREAVSDTDRELDDLLAEYQIGFVVGDKDVNKHLVEFKQALTSLIATREEAARGSEQNRLFAVLRHLGIKHDAKAIMKVRREWDANADRIARLRKGETTSPDDV